MAGGVRSAGGPSRAALIDRIQLIRRAVEVRFDKLGCCFQGIIELLWRSVRIAPVETVRHVGVLQVLGIHAIDMYRVNPCLPSAAQPVFTSDHIQDRPLDGRGVLLGRDGLKRITALSKTPAKLQSNFVSGRSKCQEKGSDPFS